MTNKKDFKKEIENGINNAPHSGSPRPLITVIIINILVRNGQFINKTLIIRIINPFNHLMC
ncbi:MAG: hypothetical protein Q8R66_11200 [Methanobacteriaceae archaeon]|nr:hypothetical protein [Methanobacteriaceae archaeon]